MSFSRNQKLTGKRDSAARAWWALPARLAFAVLVLGLLFRYVANAGETLRAVAAADLRLLALALAIGVAGEIVTSYKWQWLLRFIGQPASLWFTVRACYIGMFYNNVLPGSVGGDIAKSLLAREASGGLSRAAASVFMQRNTGFGALLIVANAAAWLPPLRMKVFPPGADILNYAGTWFAAVTIAYLGANAILLNTRWYRFFWMALARVLPAGAVLRAALKFQNMHRAFLLYRGAFPVGIGISLVTQLLDCLLVLLVFRSVGVPINYWQACVFAPASTLAALVPLSVNGVGLREALYVALLTSMAVSPERAMAASLVHYGIILAMAVIGGVMQLLPSGLPAAAIRRTELPPETR